MRTELFIYFCIKNYIGTQGEVYTSDSSKAVVPMLLFFCVAL